MELLLIIKCDEQSLSFTMPSIFLGTSTTFIGKEIVKSVVFLSKRDNCIFAVYPLCITSHPSISESLATPFTYWFLNRWVFWKGLQCVSLRKEKKLNLSLGTYQSFLKIFVSFCMENGKNVLCFKRTIWYLLTTYCRVGIWF